MPDKTSDDLLKLSQETLTFAVDLAGYEISHSPDRIAFALQQPSVYKKIQEMIEKETGQLVAPGFTQLSLSGDPAYRIGQGTLKAVGDSWETQIKGSQKYQLFTGSLDRAKSSFEKTPFGLWVDDNRTLLVISGGLLSLGGAYAMYRFRTGDPAAKLEAKMASALLKSMKLGSLDLSLGVPTFVPSKRDIEVKAGAAYKFKLVETKLDLSGRIENEKVRHLEAKSLLKVPIESGNLQFGAGAAYDRPKLPDGGDGQAVRSLNLFLGADTAPSKDLNIGLGMGAKFSDVKAPEWNAMLKATYSF